MAPKANSQEKTAEKPKRSTPPRAWLKYIEQKVRGAEDSGRITYDDLKISVNARS